MQPISNTTSSSLSSGVSPSFVPSVEKEIEQDINLLLKQGDLLKESIMESGSGHLKMIELRTLEEMLDIGLTARQFRVFARQIQRKVTFLALVDAAKAQKLHDRMCDLFKDLKNAVKEKVEAVEEAVRAKRREIEGDGIADTFERQMCAQKIEQNEAMSESLIRLFDTLRIDFRMVFDHTNQEKSKPYEMAKLSCEFDADARDMRYTIQHARLPVDVEEKWVAFFKKAQDYAQHIGQFAQKDVEYAYKLETRFNESLSSVREAMENFSHIFGENVACVTQKIQDSIHAMREKAGSMTMGDKEELDRLFERNRKESDRMALLIELAYQELKR
jgi:hypothetical protein